VREICLIKICAISFLALAFPALASPQFLPTGGNAFFGYSYVSGQTFAKGGVPLGANLSGWEASVEGKYLPWLGAVADLDWHYGGHETQICQSVGPCNTFRVNASRDSLLFGPRASVVYHRFRPFAEVLFGLAYQSNTGGGNSNSDLTFAFALGGGVDYQLLHSVWLRGQAHTVRTGFFGHSQFDPRISTGIVFRF
jgi:opacity protein-like surface antigen